MIMALLIRTVSEILTNRNIVVTMSDHAVIDDSHAETEMGTCEIERKYQIVTAKKALRAFMVFTQ